MNYNELFPVWFGHYFSLLNLFASDWYRNKNTKPFGCLNLIPKFHNLSLTKTLIWLTEMFQYWRHSNIDHLYMLSFSLTEMAGSDITEAFKSNLQSAVQYAKII